MKAYRLKWIGVFALVVFAAMNAFGENKAEVPAKPQEAAKEEPAKSTPISLTVEAIQELEKRKQELDARERQLNERAQALEMQEKILKEKLGKMEELQNKMAERLDKFKKENEGRVGKLVTMVETMRPQAAAEYVENLDPDLAVEILSRIQVVRAAKIMNLVDKKKGARLSELYTGYLEKISTNTPADVAPAAQPAAKTDKGVAPTKTQM